MHRRDENARSRLGTWIDSLPLVDVHCHINGKHPAAENPRDILFYHYVVTELVSAGAPPEAFSSDISFEETLERTLPYFKHIRNTSTHWCLIKMLRDLFDFQWTFIDEDNWRMLEDAITRRIKERKWYRKVLEKGGLKKVFLTLRHDEEIPRCDEDFFMGSLRVEPLITRLNQADIKGLEKAISLSIESIDDFEEALSLLFKKFSGCVSITASLLPEETFGESNETEARKSFFKRLSGLRLSKSEMQSLRSFAMCRILSLAEEHKLPFQLMIGVRRPVAGASPPDYAIAGFETNSLSCLCPLFHRFRDVDFDIFLANKVQSHELSVIGKNYANVYVSGYWWYTFYPAIIRQFLVERLQMLPCNKIGGFFSDSYVAEWTYAKASLVRKQLTGVLAEMVEEEYYSEELAKSLAENLFYLTPKRLYKINC